MALLFATLWHRELCECKSTPSIPHSDTKIARAIEDTSMVPDNLFTQGRQMSTEVGAVVIGRNEGQRLINCLSSVLASINCIIYVDSGSTDGSAEAAQRLGVFVVKLDGSQPYTAARARNEGFAVLRKLRPDIRLIQFIDGDCELEKGWPERAAAFLNQRKSIAIVCGRRRERFPLASVFNQLCDVEWNTPIGEASSCGGDSLIRARAFEDTGGFKAQLIAGEEPELCLRLRERGWRIWRLDAEMTRHDANIKRFGQWWIRNVRAGYGLGEVCFLHWHSPLSIWKRELARTVFWAGLLPLLICTGMLVRPGLIAVLLIYVFQISRIAIIRGPAYPESWVYGLFTTVAKFAELQGLLKFCLSKVGRETAKSMEYK